MNIDIARWCRTCKGCQTAKVSRHNTPVFGKFNEPTERFDHVHIDIVGPLPYADGFRYLLTCVDRFTRWPEAIPMVDIRAETVADAFFSGWIARYGTPATITTDRGAQFESKLWDSLCNQFGIIGNRTTSYHPQSNGMVERFHRQLKAAIMAHKSPNPWTITLPAVLLGVRSTGRLPRWYTGQPLDFQESLLNSRPTPSTLTLIWRIIQTSHAWPCRVSVYVRHVTHNNTTFSNSRK